MKATPHQIQFCIGLVGGLVYGACIATQLLMESVAALIYGIVIVVGGW